MSASDLTQKKEELKTLMEKWRLDVSMIIDSYDDSAEKRWVDGDYCPYGSPGGKFTEAPVIFRTRLFLFLLIYSLYRFLAVAEKWYIIKI